MSVLSKSLPLFKLPFFAIESVITNLNVCDIINFSFVSKNCRKLAHGLDYRITRLDIHVHKDGTRIEFMMGETMIGGWHINCKKWTEKLMETPVHAATLSGYQLRSLTDDKFLITYMDTSAAESLELAIEYLTKLLRKPVVLAYYLSPDNIPESEYPLLVKYHECQRLDIKGKQEMNMDQLKSILEASHVAGGLVNMNIPLGNSFSHDISLWQSPNHIHIWRDAHWITRDMLFNSKCTRMILRGVQQLTVQDFKQFAQRWFNSDDRTFEMLMVRWKENVLTGEDFEDLGFELVRNRRPRRRSRWYQYNPPHRTDLRFGRDFVRHDGLLATIARNDNELLFCVWHKRFPKYKKQ